MTKEERAKIGGAIDQAFQFMGTQISFPALSQQRQHVDAILRTLQEAAQILDGEAKKETQQ